MKITSTFLFLLFFLIALKASAIYTTLSGPSQVCPGRTYTYTLRTYTNTGLDAPSCQVTVVLNRGAYNPVGSVTHSDNLNTHVTYIYVTFDEVFGPVTLQGAVTSCDFPALSWHSTTFSKSINVGYSAVPAPISGDAFMCAGQTKTYSSLPLLQNNNTDCFHHKYKWQAPTGWTITPSGANPNVVNITVPTGTAAGNYTISVQAWWDDINVYSNPVIKTIYIGPKNSVQIAGPSCLSSNYYTLGINGSLPSGTLYDWKVQVGSNITYHTTSTVNVYIPNLPNRLAADVRVNTGCGWGSYNYYTAYACSGYYSMNNISMFPNSASSNVEIEIPDSLEITSLNIVNSKGKVIEKIKGNSKKIKVDVRSYEEGTYFVNFDTDKGVLTERLVIKR